MLAGRAFECLLHRGDRSLFAIEGRPRGYIDRGRPTSFFLFLLVTLRLLGVIFVFAVRIPFDQASDLRLVAH
jgi:hypothetical protein